MKRYGKKGIVFLIVCLLASFVPKGAATASAASEDAAEAAAAASVGDSVYAVTADSSVKLKLDYINVNVDSPQRQDYLALFTSGTSVTNVAGNSNEVFVKSTNAAIQVDANGVILKWIGPQGGIDPATNKPRTWDAAQNVTIPPGGFVILANDNDWLGKNFRKALYNTFHAEDTIKLEKGGAIVTAEDFIPKESGDFIEIEAPSEDITVIVEGPRKKIDYVDTDVTTIPNIIALFTNEYGDKVNVRNTNVAIQVDATGKVTAMFNAANGNSAPSWTQGGDLEIPQGGYVVMAQDNSYATYDIKKFLATKFKVGDVVKLRKNGNVVAVTELMKGTGAMPRMELNGFGMYTTPETTTVISGKVTNPTGAAVTVGGHSAVLQDDGTFSLQVALAEGPNYIDAVLSKDGSVLDTKSIIVYSRPSLNSAKQIMLWVDQASNAKKLQSSESVRQFLIKAKDAGVTDIMFDVKGVEGYVSYKKNDLTGRPYVSEMVAGDRKGSNPDIDLLELFLEHGHALGLKVHAAFNVFAEGSIAVNDFAIIDDHPEWEEHVFRPEDNGQIKPLRESEYGKKGLSGASGGAAVLFINPSNDDARQFQLKTFEEVLKNYDVDGIVLDRARYDNETADFSDLTKEKFEAFLAQRGKSLDSWPNDVFQYVNGNRVNGPLIQDWWEFRAGTITSFVEETRALVDRYSTEKGRKIETSAYVGAWFESYYLNGVHWGSKDFRYDSRLNFPNDTIYTEEYYKTGYISQLDFLMVGTYYSTEQEIQRYVTLDSIVTNGEVPLYSGMALSNLQSPALMREIFQAALGSSNGLMLFDASLANWPMIKSSIQNKEYVKDYQLGISKPDDPSSFIEASFYNSSRNLGDLNVMDEEFGTSTGTNKFGVEVIVNDSGTVTKMVNKLQAINWSWSFPEDNNSAIPPGGMVISALDENGVRTKRQLVANTYNVGDNIRAAALSGYMDYDGKTVSTANTELRGNIKVLGAGTEVDVYLNDSKATVASNGDFTGIVLLEQGANTVTFSVYVDQLKTNEKSIQMTYTPSVQPPEGGGGGIGGSELRLTADGVIIPASEVTTTDENGNPAAGVTLDLSMINSAIASLLKDGKNKKEIILEFRAAQPVSIVNVPVQALQQAAGSIDGAVLTIRAGGASYWLPADLIDAATLSELLGSQASDAQATITVERISGSRAGDVIDAIESQGGSLIGDAYDFRISLKAGDKTVAFSDFGNRYVERSFTLIGGATGQEAVVAIDPITGAMTFVPARFTTVNGATVVTIKHTGNGVYAVIDYTKSFEDIQEHWAQADIEFLASKLLVKGMTADHFAPNASITRAEFAALLVRALGLKEQAGSSFSDIRSADWFAGYAAAAAKAGLIEGYEDGAFRPLQTISREEMAVLALRAASFVAKQDDGDDIQGALDTFSDGGAISDWARSAAAFAVNEGLMNGVSDTAFAPKEQSTRAQAAVILKRLLVKVGLVD